MSCPASNRYRIQAFTLVELMIVVSIIAIITAVAIPSLLNARISANETAAIAGVKNIVSSQEAYRARFGSYAPTFDALRDRGYLDDSYAPYPLDPTVIKRRGFIFAFGANSGAKYLLSAAPENPGEEGHRAFVYNLDPAFEANFTLGAIMVSPAEPPYVWSPLD